MISYAQPLDLKALSPLFVPFALLSVASPVLSLLLELSNSHLQLYPLSFIYLILKLWVQERTTYPSGTPIRKGLASGFPEK